MPCNFHLRALGAKVKEGIRAAGGTPMELNTIAISDGITMGTAGMKASLASREVIADSIELVCDAHLFDAVVAISGCDKTIPGDRDGPVPARRAQRDALRRLDPARPLPRRAGHDPGGVRGGRCPRGRSDHRSGADRARGRRFARRRRLRRPVHRQHDGDGVRGAGDLSSRFLDGPRGQPAQGRRRRRNRPARDGRAQARPAPQRHHHPRSPRERDRRNRVQRRVHQRRPASPGDRQGGRRGPVDRRLRPHQRAHPAAVRPQAVGQVRRTRPL